MQLTFSPIRTPQAVLPSIPVVNGQLIYAYDTGRIFIDTNAGRFQQGITTLSDSSELPLYPSDKLYFVRNSRKLLYYSDGWHNLAANFGYKDVIGGYSARIKSISSSSVTLHSDSSFADIAKFSVGDTVYINIAQSDSGDFNWLKRTISAISGKVITLNKAVPSTQDYDASDALQGRYVIQVEDPTIQQQDQAFSLGAKNFATGQRAAAIGSWNTVTGICSVAQGISNTNNGDGSVALGVNNIITQDDSIAAGGNNKLFGSMHVALGTGNTVKQQGAVVLGSGNQTDAIGCIVAGNMNRQVTGFNSVVVGNSNKASGQNSITVGRSLQNRSKFGTLIGANATLSSDAQNRQAFAIGGGSGQTGQAGQKLISWLHTVNRAQLNPLYNSSLDPYSTGIDSTGQPKYEPVQGFATQYRGVLKPYTTRIQATNGANIYLQPHQYSRYVIQAPTNSSTVSVNILAKPKEFAGAPQTFQDGDIVQVIFDSTYISPSFPSQWISQGFDVSETRQYVVQITYVQGVFYYKVAWPNVAQQASGNQPAQPANIGTIACLCTQQPQPIFDGMLWVYGGTAQPRYYTAVGGLYCIPQQEAGSNLPNGTILIR